ncbi:MAG TPA: hypothetical protein PKD00_07280 [Burkholderiales bacterium]|nr:hypothetical protein [Burkholderiales bacterium]
MINNTTKCNFINLRADYSTENILRYKAINLDKLNSTINNFQSIEELQNLKSRITEIQRQLNKDELNHDLVDLRENYNGIDEQIIILCTHRNSNNKKINWFNNINFTAHAQKLIARIDKLIKIHSKFSINPIKTIKDFAFNDSIKYKYHDLLNKDGFMENLEYLTLLQLKELLYRKDYLIVITNYLRNHASPNNVKEIANYISYELKELLLLDTLKSITAFDRLFNVWYLIFKNPEIYEKLLVKYGDLSNEIKNSHPNDIISMEEFNENDEVFVLYTFDSKNNKILNLVLEKDNFIEYITNINIAIYNRPINSPLCPNKNKIIF